MAAAAARFPVGSTSSPSTAARPRTGAARGVEGESGGAALTAGSDVAALRSGSGARPGLSVLRSAATISLGDTGTAPPGLAGPSAAAAPAAPAAPLSTPRTVFAIAAVDRLDAWVRGAAQTGTADRDDASGLDDWLEEGPGTLVGGARVDAGGDAAVTCRSMAELVEVLTLSFSIITLESEAWGEP